MPPASDDAAIAQSCLPLDAVVSDTSTPFRAALAVAELNRSSDNPPPNEKQDDEERGLVISPPPFAPVQQPVAVVEATWKPTILVVDDSPMNRKMLVRMLMSKGFACVEAEDGIEGLIEVSRMNKGFRNKRNVSDIIHNNDPSHAPKRRTLPGQSVRGFLLNHSYSQNSSQKAEQEQEQEQQERYPFVIDAVLIDSNMPRMNGPEAIEEMRKIGFSGLIIGVSGGDEKTMTEFLQAGADDVMQKPAQSDVLVNMLLKGLKVVVSDYSLLMDGNGDVTRASEKARQEHIKLLRTFTEDK